MKRIIILLIISVILLFVPLVSFAMKSPVTLYLNGEKYENEHPPLLIRHTPYAPLPLIDELFNVESSWNASAQTGLIKTDDQVIEFVIDQKEIMINGMAAVVNDPPVMYQNEPYISLKWAGGYFGVKVLWDMLTQSAFLYKNHNSTFPNSKNIVESNRNSEEPEPKPDTQQSDGIAIIRGIETSATEISIKTNGPIKLKNFLLADPERPDLPDRIVLDLTQSVLGESLVKDGIQGGTIPSSHPLVSKIRYSLFDQESQTIRLVLDLTKAVDYKVVQNETTHEVGIHFLEDPFVVVIDPGHGGKDPGATGASEKDEKHFSLNISKKIHELLKKEPLIVSHLTRNEDIFVALEDRAFIANSLNADLFISIHGNTFESPISGSETYYYTESSLSLATVIHNNVVESGGLPDRKIREVGYRVLRHTNMPGVLLELGYLSNAKDENIMLTETFQSNIAAGIVKGMKEYLGIEG